MASQPAGAPTRLGLAVAGVALTLAGAIAYFLLLDQQFLRSTGLPALAGMALGVFCAVQALRRDRRKRVIILCALNGLIVAAFWGMLLLGTRLPEDHALARGDHAPDFTLPDHTGHDVHLADRLASGPVLLVFYRGHW